MHSPVSPCVSLAHHSRFPLTDKRLHARSHHTHTRGHRRVDKATARGIAYAFIDPRSLKAYPPLEPLPRFVSQRAGADPYAARGATAAAAAAAGAHGRSAAAVSAPSTPLKRSLSGPGAARGGKGASSSGGGGPGRKKPEPVKGQTTLSFGKPATPPVPKRPNFGTACRRSQTRSGRSVAVAIALTQRQ
jgi:hypothetical protein